MISRKRPWKEKGISALIATLLLIVLVFGVGVLIHTYTMGYIGGTQVPKANPGLQVQSAVQIGGGLVIYAKNISGGSLKFDPSANGLTKVYVDGKRLSQGSYQVDPVEVGEGVTCTFTIPIDSSWSGRTIEIKIFADDGTLTSLQTVITSS